MAATVASMPSPSGQHSPLSPTGSGNASENEQEGARRNSHSTSQAIPPAQPSSQPRMTHRGMIGGFSVAELERLDFDGHEFVAMARRSTPLDEICGALAGHLAELRASLIDAINQDYTAFVGMASSLKGLDKAVSKVKMLFLQLCVRKKLYELVRNLGMDTPLLKYHGLIHGYSQHKHNR
jgi:hypothetical protein